MTIFFRDGDEADSFQNAEDHPRHAAEILRRELIRQEMRLAIAEQPGTEAAVIGIRRMESNSTEDNLPA